MNRNKHAGKGIGMKYNIVIHRKCERDNMVKVAKEIH